MHQFGSPEVHSRGAAAEKPAALLRCDPAGITGVAGQPFEFEIYVEDIVDLWAGDVRLSFDPAIVQIVDADPDAEGIQIVLLDDFLTANFVLRKNGDNETGAIWYAATHLNGPWDHEPANGSGALARVTLEPLQAGSFVMAFTYHLLNDVDGFEIEATAADCPVTITDAPDPGTITYRLPPAFVLSQDQTLRLKDLILVLAWRLSKESLRNGHLHTRRPNRARPKPRAIRPSW